MLGLVTKKEFKEFKKDMVSLAVLVSKATDMMIDIGSTIHDDFKKKMAELDKVKKEDVKSTPETPKKNTASKKVKK